MRRNRIWLLAVAVMIVGASVVMALSYTPISNIITGSNSVTTPSLTIYWVIPIPASEIASIPITATFNVANPYGASFQNLVLVLNFTGSGVTSSCATSGSCVQGSLTTGSTTVPLSACTSCGTTTIGSTPVPEFILVGTIPSLPGGNDLVSLSLSFIHGGTFNQHVYLATSVPYP
jgi:hypothetical protein